MVSEQINQGTPWETISVNLVIDGPQCSPTSQAEEYSLERDLNGLVCRDRGTPVLTLWGTHDQGQPTTPLEPTLSLTGKAIQAKPGSPENAAIPGIDEMYRPRKPKPWPRYQLAPMAKRHSLIQPLPPFNPLKQKASRYAIPARLVIRTTTLQTKQEAWPALPCCWWASSWKHYLLTPRLHRLQSTSRDRKGKKALLQPALTPFEHPLKEGWAGMQYRPHFQEW